MMKRIAAPALAMLVLSSVARGAAPDGTEARGAANAAASQPSIQALRGGTLGLPMPSSNGITAVFNNQVDLSGDYGFTFLAQVGGLELSEAVKIDVIGESFSAAVPRAEATPGSNIIPLPQLNTLTFQALGVRLTYRVAMGPEPLDPVGCIALDQIPMPPRAAWSSADITFAQAQAKGLGLDCAENCRAICAAQYKTLGTNTKEGRLAMFTDEQRAKLQGIHFSAGVRALFKTSDDEDPRSTGFAGELSAQLTQDWGGLFLSGIASHLTSSEDVVGETHVLDAAVTEGGFTLGGYWQGATLIGDAQLLPTIGGYVRVTRNFWNNEFVQVGTSVDDDVRGTQLEIGTFLRGHFTNGFSGLIGFSVLQPYGRHDDLQVVVSVAPIVGAAL